MRFVVCFSCPVTVVVTHPFWLADSKLIFTWLCTSYWKQIRWYPFFELDLWSSSPAYSYVYTLIVDGTQSPLSKKHVDPPVSEFEYMAIWAYQATTTKRSVHITWLHEGVGFVASDERADLSALRGIMPHNDSTPPFLCGQKWLRWSAIKNVPWP
jgi:hypothetical protein